MSWSCAILRFLRGWTRRWLGTEALVQRGDEAAQCHRRRAQPDPAHEGLDVQAYRPVALGAVRIVDGAQRFAQRDVDVTEQSAVDARLGHPLAAAGVRALLRVHKPPRFARATELSLAGAGRVIGAGGVVPP